MFVRLINEPTKNMIQGTGRIYSLGMYNFLNIIAFFCYGFYLIAILGLKEDGYCLAIFIYELLSLVICLYFYFFVIEEEIRDTSKGIFTNIGWYFCEVLKYTSANIGTFITFDAVIILLVIARQPD